MRIQRSKEPVVVVLALVLAASAFASAFAAAPSPVADAVEKSDLATLRTLLKQRADVDAPKADGMTALHWAAHLDDLEAAKLLLVQPLNLDDTPRGNALLAIDGVGAGVHERVLVVLEGRAAGEALGKKGAPVDAAVIGIIDSVSIDEHL